MVRVNQDVPLQAGRHMGRPYIFHTVRVRQMQYNGPVFFQRRAGAEINVTHQWSKQSGRVSLQDHLNGAHQSQTDQ